MVRPYILLAAFFVGTMAPPAIAADAFVATTSPTVSSSSGRGFTRVPTLKPVEAGAQVVAGESGSGWIIYCGCDVEIKPGRVYTVKNRECKVESVDIRRPRLPHIVNYPDGQRGEEELTRCRVAPWWVLGAAVPIGICAGAGCFDADDDRRRSASP